VVAGVPTVSVILLFLTALVAALGGPDWLLLTMLVLFLTAAPTVGLLTWLAEWWGRTPG
jgi:hypothetical protein